jgi:hypothetical protein
MAKVEIRQKQAHLRRENKLWPSRLTAVSEDRWCWQLHKPQEVWRSAGFLVQLFQAESGASRMSVNRTMVGNDGRWVDGITWEELMRLKDECGHGHDWAVEVLPPNYQVVDVANMRHLWLLPEAPRFAWKREVTDAKG